MANQTLPAEQRVILSGIGWETYEKLLCDLQDSSAPRLAFDRGVLEIMSPLLRHERRNRALDQIVLASADACDRDIVPIGSTTFKRAALQRGFEADSSYYIQSVPNLPDDLSELEDLDSALLPAPDLVIEVDITNSSLNKMPLYAAFGVPEVWRDEGEQVTILLRNSSGDGYDESERSAAFPELDAQTLTRFVASSLTLRRNDWRREVRGWWAAAAAQGEGA